MHSAEQKPFVLLTYRQKLMFGSKFLTNRTKPSISFYILKKHHLRTNDEP